MSRSARARRMARLYSPARPAANSLTQLAKIRAIGGTGGGRCSTLDQQFTQMGAFLVLTDEIPNVLAAGAVAPPLNLFVHEALQSSRQGDIHRAHRETYE